ncbi:Protein CutA 1, chloroplastic [Tetrabaena socialis]|uniref:Protein CutA 1, chloroplastic n=1 Tax=Tetrabaena socialis TaxID=47790 RepID=A0A2J8A159_9CHLO|nr:Protein CutA 1, chloroplastic [Tetrabaena socialis]|eukprot:PNH06228.1 Protein CutA 1, chloroplastic [Tetrabaena socialis]
MTPLWRGILAAPALRRTPLPAATAAAAAACPAAIAAGGTRQPWPAAPAAAATAPTAPKFSLPRARWQQPPRSSPALGRLGGGAGGVLGSASRPRTVSGPGAVAATSMSSGADAPGSSPSGTIVVYVTVPSAKVGDALASKIVEARLAACVNILPGVTSVYWWDGKVNKDPELLLIIKTRAELLPQLTDFVRANHPYDEPEVVALPILGGSPTYLQWLKDNTAPAAVAAAAAAAAAGAADEGGAGKAGS